MNGYYFLWLIPEEPHYNKFLSVISDLSKMLSGVSFLPHVTLCTSQHPDIFDIYVPPLNIQLKNICHSDHFFQSIYIDIHSDELENIRNTIAQKTQIPTKPHISLYYGDISTSKRQNICSDLHLGIQKCRLYQKVLVFGETSQGYTSVRSWQIVKTEVLK